MTDGSTKVSSTVVKCRQSLGPGLHSRLTPNKYDSLPYSTALDLFPGGGGIVNDPLWPLVQLIWYVIQYNIHTTLCMTS